METDNAQEKAFKIGQCKNCGEKIWFWRKICHNCYLVFFEGFKKLVR